MATGHVRDGCSFPVGFIVHFTTDVDPAEYFGGKWQRIKGRFLLAADDTYPAGSTGGEAAHKLTVAEIPAHSHAQYVTANSGSQGIRHDFSKDGNASRYPQGTNTGETGDGQPHNNMPPYRSVYIWERIG